MIEVYERAMNDAERRSLERHLAAESMSLPARFLLRILYLLWCLGLLLVATVSAAAIFTLLKDARLNPWLVPITLITFGPFLVVPAWLLSRSLQAPGETHRATKRFHERVRAQIDNGRVKVTRVVARRVITIEQWEDEGEAAIFEVSDRLSVTLFGQSIRQNGTIDWPASEFEYVCSAWDEDDLGIFNVSGPLTPELELDWSHFQDGSLFDWPTPLAVVEKTPEEILSEWKYLGQSSTDEGESK